ncbi:CheR family methyltransferase [Thioalkalivibrio halophilus]|uniref:protein-glutamate O-methyltransferase n=1 Tax=Thioalkalivibrio halophilus TaxID=252474 RepID=A0A1V3A339_9GAMM|nr:protein-glutamate O-methyltransferase CheR [Thioalkalivibrio halophilus]OOC11503.1 chemotaxis protein [Thioalkalivibrio halophilus]
MIDSRDYEEFARFLSECCGLVLGDSRQYLVSSRLSRLLDEFGYKDVPELLHALRKAPSPKLRTRVIDAMTTNETSWFRDGFPFEILRHVILPELASTRSSIKVWSAGCSSGQEPYSISMVVSEWEASRPRRVVPVSILGTDLSEGVLDDARKAVYDGLSIVRGLSESRRSRFFQTVPEGHKIIPEVQRRCRFQKLNLVDSYAALGKFDIVFCRNVLIYFSAETKRQVLDGIAKQLNPGGYLFLGASETVGPYSKAYETVRTEYGSVLRLKG